MKRAPHLAGLIVAAMLLGGCGNVGLLASGGSSSGVNFGLTLDLDLFKFEKKQPKSGKAPRPDTDVDDASKPAKKTEDKTEDAT